MRFAPSVLVKGKTVTPKGYEWILGFAIGGCEWAIAEASKPEFLAMVRADLEQTAIARLECRIEELQRHWSNSGASNKT